MDDYDSHIVEVFQLFHKRFFVFLFGVFVGDPGKILSQLYRYRCLDVLQFSSRTWTATLQVEAFGSMKLVLRNHPENGLPMFLKHHVQRVPFCHILFFFLECFFSLLVILKCHME